MEINLWNNWNRHFNDEGRFTQIDPLWSKYPSLSPYVRVANNPLRFVDEDGKRPITVKEARYVSNALEQFERNLYTQLGYDNEAMRHEVGRQYSMSHIDNPIPIGAMPEWRNKTLLEKILIMADSDMDPNTLNGKIDIFGIEATVRVIVKLPEHMNINQVRNADKGNRTVIIKYSGTGGEDVYLTMTKKDYEKLLKIRNDYKIKGGKKYREDNNKEKKSINGLSNTSRGLPGIIDSGMPIDP